jgi:hypothetical protein
MTKPDTAKTPAGPPPVDRFPHYTPTVNPIYGMLPFGRYEITLHPVEPLKDSGLLSSSVMIGGFYAYTLKGAISKARRLAGRYSRRSDRRKLRADQLEYLRALNPGRL